MQRFSAMQTRTVRNVGLALLGVALAVFGVITWLRLHHNTGELFVSDGYYYYSYLPTWWIDGDFDLTNQYRHRPEEAAVSVRQQTRTGLPENPFAVGMAVVLTPAFWLARAAHGLNGDGWSVSYQVPVYTCAFLIALAGPWITYLVLRRFFPPRVAGGAVGAMVLGSPWVAYIWFEPDFPHAISAAAVASFLFALLLARDKPRTGPIVLAGLLLGLAVLIRTQNALLLALVPLVLGRQPIRIYAALAGAALLAFLPQPITWHAIYGWWIGVPQPPGYVRWDHPLILTVLFAMYHGLFTWTPLALLALAGFWFAPRAERKLVWGMLAVLAGEIYVNASFVADPVGAGGFGLRRMVDYLPLFAFGLASLLAARKPAVTRTAAWVSGVLVCFNLLLVVRFYTSDLPRNEIPTARQLWIDTAVYPFHRH